MPSASKTPQNGPTAPRGRPRTGANAALAEARINAARRAVATAYARLGAYEALSVHYGAAYSKATFYRLLNDPTFKPSTQLICAIEAAGPVCAPAAPRRKRARRVTVALPVAVAAQLDAARLPGESRVAAVRRLTDQKERQGND